MPNLRFSSLLTALAVLNAATVFAQVTGFAIVKPTGAPGAVLTLPGSVRRIPISCKSGCSTTSAATWSVSATTGNASATLKPSPSGNYVDVTLGAAAGSCPVVPLNGGFTVSSTASVTLKATSVDDALQSDKILLDVCSPVVEAYTIPFYRVLYAGQHEDVQGVIWGASNTDGSWAIASQPSGGDGVLDDTRYQDTVFHATVAGTYKVRWTSSADPSKTAYSTFYVTGNPQPRLAQPNGTQPVDCTTDPTTTGGTLEVGPTQKYINLEAISPAQVVPGVTIRLHNEDTTGSNPTTYHEWVQINGIGAHDNPIRLCGVPDSAGHLPVLDGKNATARGDVLSQPYTNGLAGIMVYKNNYDPYPAYNGPAYVVVEGLALRNFSPNSSYYAPGTTTSPTAYGVGTSGFRFQNCRDCEFNGSEVSFSGNGVFSESNDSRAWGGVSERLLFEGNNVHDNGVTNDTHEHNWYLQGFFQVVQFNQMPSYNKAAQGSQYKDRGISWFRYNYVGTGAQRMMDLVEDQDAPNYLDPSVYLTNMRPSEPRDAYTGDQLAAAQEAWHHSATVYGNLFAQANSGSIHFSGDNLGGSVLRTGVLDFYNNTVNATGSNTYRFAWFDTGDNGNNLPHVDWPTVNASNLVITGISAAGPPFFSWNTQRDAFMNFGKVLLPTNWGTNNQSCTVNTTGACDGTGWPYQSNIDVYFNGNLFNTTGTANFIGAGSTVPLNLTTYQISSAIAGDPLTGSQAKLPVRFQYVPALGYAAPRSTVVNDLNGGTIGGTDSLSGPSTPPPPPPPPTPVPPTAPTPVAITLIPGAVTLAPNASAVVSCVTTLSDKTTRPCIGPSLTSNNQSLATVTGLTVIATANSGSGTLLAVAEGLSTTAAITVNPAPPATVGPITIRSPKPIATRPVGVPKPIVVAAPAPSPVSTGSNGPARVDSPIHTSGTGAVAPITTSIALRPASVQLTPGQSTALSCTASLSDGTRRPCNTPLFSGDSSMIELSGLTATAKTQTGTTLITAHAEGQTAVAAILIVHN